jgi:hypothetical protein
VVSTDIESKKVNEINGEKCCIVCCEFEDGVEKNRTIQTVKVSEKKWKVKAPISYLE